MKKKITIFGWILGIGLLLLLLGVISFVYAQRWSQSNFASGLSDLIETDDVRVGSGTNGVIFVRIKNNAIDVNVVIEKTREYSKSWTGLYSPVVVISDKEKELEHIEK